MDDSLCSQAQLQARPVPGLLLIEADADQLQRDGITRSIDELETIFRSMVARGTLRYTRLKIRSEADIENARRWSAFLRYDAVVIVGHGSRLGLDAALGAQLEWSRVGQLLAPLQPRVLLSISCFGSSWQAANALFSAIPTLKLLLGSPVPLSARQARLAVLDLVSSLFGARMPGELSAALAILNACLTGGIVYRRTRSGFFATSAADLAIEDVLAIAAREFLRPAHPTAGGSRRGSIPRQRRLGWSKSEKVFRLHAGLESRSAVA